MDSFLQTLSFSPDPFQLDAMKVIQDGQSVVVCAPTGSGKTLIAEFAAHHAIAHQKKLFYTTPLKALSNQKFNDLRQQYGDDQVGLLTGDTSVNRDARIVVMTTEVFRNMLYRYKEDSKLLDQVGYVVLDECHYMNDAERGTVWEETVIYCPPNIQLIALSATVANSQELTDWINDVHHNTTLISSNYRPVPLRYFFFNHQDQLLPLFKSGTNKVNAKLKFGQRGRRGRQSQVRKNPVPLIQTLAKQQMLPAIFFTFSRKGCDKSLFATKNLNLLTPDETHQIRQLVDEAIALHPYLAQSDHIRHIRNGFASHHAGLLPGLKTLVESLFEKGLIKVVFATETLAAGINMPARTTVITAVSKRTGEGHRMLTASEFLQMSGRAGRRGMDDMGFVITVHNPFESPFEIAQLASSPPDPLNSQFTPTYGMVLNLLQRYPLEEVQYLISKSFGAFTINRRLAPLRQDLDYFTKKRDEALHFECPYELTDEDFKRYLRNKEKLYGVHKNIKMYKRQQRQFKSPDGELTAALEQEEAKRNSLKATLSATACDTCEVFKQHDRRQSKLKRFEKKLKRLNRNIETESNLYWRLFTNHYNLLKATGFIDDKDVPTQHGEMTAQIRAENEFYVAQLILHNVFDDLDASELAGVVCAIVHDSGRDTDSSYIPMSPSVKQTLIAIDKQRKEWLRLQKAHHVYTDMTLSFTACGLIQAWAEGMDWGLLIRKTNMAEGDIVRIVRRTADMLRQLQHISEVPSDLQLKARIAHQSILRDPVADDTILHPENTSSEEPLP